MGAASRSWRAEEHLADADIERAIAGGPVGVIVSHDCPDGVSIPGLAPDGLFPPERVADAEAHRLPLGMVVDATPPGLSPHGRLHSHHNAVRRPPGGGQTAIAGLGGDIGSLSVNVLLLDLRRSGETGGALLQLFLKAETADTPDPAPDIDL